MMVGSILLVGLSLARPAQSPVSPAPQQSGCAQASADALTDGAAGEICAGDDAVRLANAAPKDSAEKTRQLEAAAGHYRKAALHYFECTVSAVSESGRRRIRVPPCSTASTRRAARGPCGLRR